MKKKQSIDDLLRDRLAEPTGEVPDPAEFWADIEPQIQHLNRRPADAVGLWAKRLAAVAAGAALLFALWRGAADDPSQRAKSHGFAVEKRESGQDLAAAPGPSPVAAPLVAPGPSFRGGAAAATSSHAEGVSFFEKKAEAPAVSPPETDGPAAATSDKMGVSPTNPEAAGPDPKLPETGEAAAGDGAAQLTAARFALDPIVSRRACGPAQSTVFFQRKMPGEKGLTQAVGHGRGRWFARVEYSIPGDSPSEWRETVRQFQFGLGRAWFLKNRWTLTAEAQFRQAAPPDVQYNRTLHVDLDGTRTTYLETNMPFLLTGFSGQIGVKRRLLPRFSIGGGIEADWWGWSKSRVYLWHVDTQNGWQPSSPKAEGVNTFDYLHRLTGQVFLSPEVDLFRGLSAGATVRAGFTDLSKSAAFLPFGASEGVFLKWRF